jgi:hypothetical protein
MVHTREGRRAMTAIRTVDPAIEIMARIERGRARVRQQRSASLRFPLYEDGRFVGAIRQPKGVPAFGPAAPTVLLMRDGERR